MKRYFDIIISCILLIVLLPILIVISICIKLTSNGSILFKQKRIGIHNKEFILYKFRTMKVNTPDVATHLLKKPDDYITPIGKFLRKSSLDELPQLMNILKGDMTFIGPRPALYNQYDLIEMRTKVGVHNILPGVTGWAQINGRDSINNYEKVKFDEYYYKHKSMGFDMKILFLTISRVINADGIVEGGDKQSIKMEDDRHSKYEV